MGWSSRETRRRALVLLGARLCHLRVEESNADVASAGGKEKMRIGDVLHEQDINSGVVTTPNSGNRSRRGGRWEKKGNSSPSPRCLLSRWLSSKQFMKCRSSEEEYEDKDKEATEEEAEEEEGQEEVEGGCVSCALSLESAAGASTRLPAGREEEVLSTLEAVASTNKGGKGPVNSEDRKMKGSVHNPEQTFLSIGMGASLVFLLTRSITEFNKMTELRGEMELLLKEIKGATQKNDLSPKSAESKNNLTFCCSDSWGDTDQQCNNLPCQDYLPCLMLPEARCIAEHGCHTKYKRDHEDSKSLSCQIEAELESELEALQLNLDKQDSAEQLMMESSSNRTDLSEGFSVNLHPEQKGRIEKEVDTRHHHGVCPHELTRRLHEVLEARQEERITELEAALQLAHIKLREKEMEACWWRDTARLASQHKPEGSVQVMVEDSGENIALCGEW